MTVCYDMSVEIIGKKKELISVLKYLNNYNKNHKEIYFDNMLVEFTAKKISKDFNNNFYINDSTLNIRDEDLEKNLDILGDNKEYNMSIKASGPYGKFNSIEEIGFFEEMADISLDITFEGEIVGGDYLPENRLEAHYKNKKLYMECFLFWDNCVSIYANEVKKILSYDKFCNLFNITIGSFNENMYDDFIKSEIAYHDFPYFYSYDSFKEMCPTSNIGELEYEKAIEDVEELKLESITEFFYYRRQDYWNVIEYNPVTKEKNDEGKHGSKSTNNTIDLKNIDSETYNKLLDDLEEYTDHIKKVPAPLQNNRKFILDAVKRNGFVLNYIDNELRNDQEIAIEAIKNNFYVFHFISDELQQNKEVVLEAVKRDGFILKKVSTELKDDKDIVLAAVKQDGNALKFASQRLQDTEKIVLEAVKQNSEALQYASERLQEKFK